MRHIHTRRDFLRGSAAAGAGLWLPSRGNLRVLPTSALVRPDGTTLEASIAPTRSSPYRRLTDGPGWPTLVRDDLARLDDRRTDRRRPLVSLVHLTDVHVIDAQSPGRVEFLDGFGGPFTAAFRPQETLTTQVAASMVERINRLGAGPVTGRPFDCAVSTGDNIDNCQHNELDWFVTVLDGGAVTPSSGDPDRYEGVQDPAWADPRYWHPDGRTPDRYAERGYPTIDGFLSSATAGFRSPGLDVPWYATYGNHDGLVQGNLPRTDAADALLVSDTKIVDLGPGTSPLAFAAQLLANPAGVADAVRAGSLPTRTVTPDASRRTIQRDEWIRRMLDSTGPNPAPGHGYDESHLDNDGLYFRFEVAPGVVGLSLDTGAYNSGSIGEGQMAWLERELTSVHSRHFDTAGNEVRSGADDQLVLLFSHFTASTLTGFLPDPARPGEKRVQGQEFVTFLQRWPNVVAWINGHTHTNSIEPMPDPSGRTPGFWQITTASHVDFPEQARIVELADNDDGTVSIFTTLIEHVGPARADYGDLSTSGLASISRELAVNSDADAGERHLGPLEARNVELGWQAPFDLRRAGIGVATTTTTTTTTTRPTTTSAERAAGASASDDGWSTGALVGAGAGVAGAAALVGGAVALRRRRGRGEPTNPSTAVGPDGSAAGRDGRPEDPAGTP